MKHKNLKEKVSAEILLPFVESLRAKDEVVGIVLLGGLGLRDSFDKFSDVDVGVFFERLPEQPYLPPFSFHVKFGRNSLEFNLSQLLLPLEVERQWDAPQREAYANSIILYDRDGSVQKLITEKTKISPDFVLDRLVQNINQYIWRVKIHSYTCYRRGIPEASHALISDGVDLLINSIYILNACEIPHQKWRYRSMDSLAYVPSSALAAFREALLVRSFMLRDINRRIRTLDPVFEELLTEIKSRFPEFPNYPYRYWAEKISGRQLLANTFADNITDSWNGTLSEDEMRMVHGFISYTLSHDVASLKKTFAEFGSNMFSKKTYAKLKRLLSETPQ